MATKARSTAGTPDEEPTTTTEPPTQIGDVNTSLTAPAEAPALPEIEVGPPQFSPPPVGPHYMRILSDVTIQTPPYAGFKFQMVKNFKMGEWDGVNNPNSFDTQAHALARIVLKHYDWCDDEGAPIPAIQADPVAFLNAIPMDLYGLLVQAVLQEARRVPDLPARGR